MTNIDVEKLKILHQHVEEKCGTLATAIDAVQVGDEHVTLTQKQATDMIVLIGELTLMSVAFMNAKLEDAISEYD